MQSEIELIAQINALVDNCLPECRPKREFKINWKNHGIDHAFLVWRRDWTLLNEQFLPRLELLIIEASNRNVRIK